MAKLGKLNTNSGLLNRFSMPGMARQCFLFTFLFCLLKNHTKNVSKTRFQKNVGEFQPPGIWQLTAVPLKHCGSPLTRVGNLPTTFNTN